MAENDRQKRQSFDQRPRRESAVLSKLVFDDLSPGTYNKSGNRGPQTPPMDYLEQVSQHTASITRDLDSMKQLLPDLELASQILVSSILSPKDMSTPRLAYLFSSSFGDEELGARLIEIVRNYFEQEWELSEELSDMLQEILFSKGAFIRMIVPESSVDELINESGRLSMESVSNHFNPVTMSARPLGLLGEPRESSTKNQLGMESLSRSNAVPSEGYSEIGPYIRIADNPDTLKLPRLYRRYRQESVRNALRGNYSLESRAKKRKDQRQSQKDTKKDDEVKKENRIQAQGKSDRELEKEIRQRREYTHQQVHNVKTDKQTQRSSIGHPMTIKLDTEAVIPAHAPSSPEEHIGYFVLLDQHGYPISATTAVDHYQQLQEEFRSNRENSVEKVLREMRGNQAIAGTQSHYESLTQATNAFASIIENNLLERLRQGPGYDGAELKRVDEVYQIMFARACRKKHTQVLFVPEELVSYIAFHYNSHGVGESLLEKSRVLGSVRVLLMFANTMAAIQNAASKTNVKVQLDPNDSDPMSTIDIVRDSIIRSRQEQYPLGESDPSSMLNYLQRAGISISYSGHDALPEMDVDMRTESADRNRVDTDLEEKLRHSHIMSLGLSPETVDVSRGVDFATSLVQSSLLLNKRVAVYQKNFERPLAEFIRKYVRNSEELLSQLYETIEEHNNTLYKEDLDATVESFLDSFYVHLPKPDSVSLQSQMEAFEEYQRGLDEAINAWVNEDMVQDDVQGDLSRNIREFRESIRAYYVRRWLRENDVFPELNELTQRDEDNEMEFDFANVHDDHMSTMMEHLERYHQKASYSAAQRQQNIEKLKEELKKEFGFDPSDVGGGDMGDTTQDQDTTQGGDEEGDELGGFDDLMGGDESEFDF